MKIVDSLTLNMAGESPDYLPLDEFLAAISGVRGLLKALDRGKTLDWQIAELSMRSPLLMRTDASPQKRKWNSGIADSARKVFLSLNENRTPEGVNKSAITNANKVMKAVDGRISKLSIVSPHGSVEIRRRRERDEIAYAIVPRLQNEPREYRADVELTGILETATTAFGNLVFYVRDPLNNRKTECDVPRELFNKALDAMKRERPRVAVSGRTRYADGYPSRMQVATFEVWPGLDDHPGLFAVQGINITGGTDAAEYLRSIRGD